MEYKIQNMIDATQQEDFDYLGIEYAHSLLSSLEAWQRVDENHTAKTPERFVKMLHQMTDREPFNFTTFPNSNDNHDMIVLSPISFYTFCAHHIVPFYGVAHIAYVPGDQIAGLSKFARTVKYCAKGFWVQEELTTEIADFLEEKLQPQGLGIVLQAEHMCMAMRGVEESGVKTTTSAMRGVFADHSRTAKAEFLNLINGNSHK